MISIDSQFHWYHILFIGISWENIILYRRGTWFTWRQKQQCLQVGQRRLVKIYRVSWENLKEFVKIEVSWEDFCGLLTKKLKKIRWKSDFWNETSRKFAKISQKIEKLQQTHPKKRSNFWHKSFQLSQNSFWTPWTFYYLHGITDSPQKAQNREMKEMKTVRRHLKKYDLMIVRKREKSVSFFHSQRRANVITMNISLSESFINSVMV